jgi:multisubunit Na+/H+ antiporter MnhE subunit
VMTTVIALSPGTMVVDVDRTSSTVYVHFLFLRDLDAARASLDRLEQIASATIRPATAPPHPGAT